MYYRIIPALLLLLIFSTAQADTFSYHYLGVFKDDGDIDIGRGQTVDVDLIGITGSIPINKTVFATASYADGDIEDSVDIEAWSIGLGAHFPLNHTTDFVVGISHSEATLSNGSQSFTADGEDISLGLRAQVNPQLEVFAYYSIEISSSEGEEDNNSIGFGGLINISPTVALGFGLEKSDDFDSTTINLRVYFD
ncbi:MAG: hypothetical protein COB30_002275 [Ectothiorhodospiraceae bacterium]|nr:hypothetical protein [Ectothiorhodospiraceae bacterium]